MRTTNLILIALFLLLGCGKQPVNPTSSNNLDSDTRVPLHNATGLLKDPKGHLGRVFWRPIKLVRALQDGTVPDSYDSRLDGCIMGIKNQGGCGSCWAHGTVSAAEINYCKLTGDKSPLTAPWATQPDVSCNSDFYGCNGGLFAGKFHQKYGFFLESQWPYTSGNGFSGRCNQQKLKTTKPVVMPSSFVYIGAPGRAPTYDETTAAIAEVGAVAVSAGAGGDWYGPKDEDTILTKCYGTSMNHEVTAVGYHLQTKDLTIKNSWGTDFGAKGYIRIAWGCDSLSDTAGYFVFEGQGCQPPKVSLPAEYIINLGAEIIIAVTSQKNTTYSWLQAGKVIGTGSSITLKPSVSTAYNLIAKNACGEAEIMTQVTVK